MMPAQLVYEPLSQAHLDELAALLRNEQVYRFIGGSPPSEADFLLGLSRAVEGPPAQSKEQIWLNYAVRDVESGTLLGRLEATVHHSIAEVAFLFGPTYWGKGFATVSLLWLHDAIRSVDERLCLWATTTPDNSRSRALLERCGYRAVLPADAPHLLTYDPGDVVYRGPCET